jgi:hypothetical protein
MRGLHVAQGLGCCSDAWTARAGAAMIAAVNGWRSVEELTRYGFARGQVVMANEAHNRLERCIRTREVGVRMIRAAHEAGVRRLAMEALPWPEDGSPGPIRTLPSGWGGYLAQPDMRRLIATALALGWSLWAYEATMEVSAPADPAELLTLEFSNRRDHEQARNLCRVLAAAPAEPLLVWTGGDHARKEPIHGWVTMGCHFPALSGVDPFVIDQTVSIDFTGQPTSRAQELVSALGETLNAFGGTAGILRDQAPPPLNEWSGVDAVIVSTDNKLT